MVDLTAQPFNLDAEGVQWVKDTIAGMTDDNPVLLRQTIAQRVKSDTAVVGLNTQP